VIVYADTSALVKLFVEEENSAQTRAMLGQAQAMGTGLLTRVELGAALARGARLGYLSEPESLDARKQLAAVWPTWIHIIVDENLIARAERLAWEHGLRGYDAVHLASALAWQAGVDAPVVLATFDQELWLAAKNAGLESWPEDD
jgi:predicted nucleic acid-binding protein